MIIPITTIKINQNKSFGFTALESIIIDGKESAVTLIIKERIVPTPTPFANNASATGIVPKISAYIGVPRIVGRKVKTEFEITRPVYSNLEMNIRLFYFCAGNPNRIIAVEKINADVSLGKGG